MSSGGAAIGGALGAIGGFLIGGPVFGIAALKGAMYGAQIGMTIGGYLDPPKGPDVKGPRLDDLTVQTSTYGAVITRNYGTKDVFGNVFWLENNQIKEVAKKKKSGGKGGPTTTTTTYSYFATFALGLCEGPITAIRRIWINGKLIYDGQTSDQGAIRTSKKSSAYFQLYTGTDTQTADPRMQATLGANNVPGYRGLAYIVFSDLPLKDYGNSLAGAQIKVEVVGSGSIADYQVIGRLMPTAITGTQIWTDVAWNGRLMVAGRNPDTLTTDVIATSPDGITWTVRNLPAMPASIGGVREVEANSEIFLITEAWAVNYLWRSTDGIAWVSIPLPSARYWNVAWDGTDWMLFPCETDGQAYLSKDGVAWTPCVGLFSPYGSFYGGDVLKGNGTVFLALRLNDAYIYTKETGQWKIVNLPGTNDFYRCCWSHDLGIWIACGVDTIAISSDQGDTWTSYTCNLGNIFVGSGWLIWIGDVFFTASTNVAYYSYDGITWVARTLTGAYALSPYGGCWNGAVVTVVGSDSLNGADCFTITPTVMTQSSPTLANVVEAELLKSELLDAGDIDVTQLASTNVRGYAISSVAALRSGIEPLQAAWPFDVIQAGYKIKFVKRGGASIATVSAGELDARGAGESPGVSITNAREMDIVLPRKVRLMFSDFGREYDIGEQYAERLNTDAINVRTVELAIVLTAAEAAGMAEVLLYLAWLERYDVTFTLPPTYNQIEPSDIITIDADEGQYILRITSSTYTQDGRIECQAKYHAALTYTATAVGVSGAVVDQVIGETGQTTYAVLDIPTILDTTDTPGVAVAMSGYSAGWNGGTLFKSDDAGQIWSDMQGTAAPGTTMGNTTTILAAGRTDIIDTVNTLTVSMINGTLSSVSESSMFAGANWFAIGSHGRWEIVAAKTCTMVSDSIYTLSDFLRGRYGTELAMTTHAAIDWIVQLDGDTAAFVNFPLSAIGVEHYYRGVTNGDLFDSASNYVQSYTGVALECLAPVYFNANFDRTTSDWAISWIRRTRIGGEWKDNIDAPLSEATEAYEIDICNSDYTIVKRTLTATSQSVAYTQAQQIVDFGGVQGTIYAKVYQMSANVGRGYPLTGSVEITYSKTPSVEYLIVAGGGGGGTGSAGSYAGGGGGAGGVRESATYAVTSGTALTVTVGAGGAASTNGQDSSFDGVVSVGGGRGRGNLGAPITGGTGGGEYHAAVAPTNNTALQGYSGGGGTLSLVGSPSFPCGGGGGASGVGGNGDNSTVAGNGGPGLTSTKSGASVTYAGGGGGACYSGGTAGTGGTGGGGAGSSTGVGTAGTDGLGAGGGGGAGGSPAFAGGKGGNGVVIIRYQDTYQDPVSTTGSPTVTVTGGYKIYKWLTTGSITF